VADEIESASDHRYITFDIRRRSADGGGPRRPTAATASVKKRGKIDQEVVKEELRRRCASLESPDEQDMEKLLQGAWEKSTPRAHSSSRNKVAVYWWTQEIADERRRCIALRRKMVRGAGRRRRRGRPSEGEDVETAAAAARKRKPRLKGQLTARQEDL
jgi:hypothetical protein